MVKKELEFLKEINYSPNIKKKYTYIKGDFHKVIFSHEKKTKEIILNIIKHYPGIKWKIIRLFIYLNFHKFLKGTGPIETLKLKIDSSLNYPGEIILIDQRKKVFDLKNKKIYYVLKNGSEINKEFILREKYPGINFVPLLKKDRDRKVMIMRFLDLETFNKITKMPQKILQNSFDQLIYFYKKNRIKKKKTSKEIKKIWLRNNNFKSLDKKSRKIITLAYVLLNNDKKLTFIKAHGDFHLAHIGKSKEDGKIYILDWEGSKEENLLFDFFWMILVDCRVNGRGNIEKLVYKNGLNRTPFRRIFLKFEKEFKEYLNMEIFLRYFMLTLIRLIEEAYKNKRLKDAKVEVQILNKITRFIKQSF